MRLVNVYPPKTGIWPFRFRAFDPVHVLALYDLLAERTPEQSISHKWMPTYPQHVEFVRSEPYAAWYVAEQAGNIVGAVYLSRADEIGVSIFRSCQRRGYASCAVHLLMRMHPRQRYLANVNPLNEPSAALFRSLGFYLVQHTYAKEVGR